MNTLYSHYTSLHAGKTNIDEKGRVDVEPRSAQMQTRRPHPCSFLLRLPLEEIPPNKLASMIITSVASRRRSNRSELDDSPRRIRRSYFSQMPIVKTEIKYYSRSCRAHVKRTLQRRKLRSKLSGTSNKPTFAANKQSGRQGQRG